MKMLDPVLFNWIRDTLKNSDDTIRKFGLSPEQTRVLLDDVLCLEITVRAAGSGLEPVEVQ